ncbi:GNAT family N-acetyltransferase [Intestinimonas sp.]|uniref:GNAT family N-acetyltransferase n=1 Tax=Intestinimonas sp. TaxID=1965293 RepID=UPI003AAA42D9
MQPVYETRRLRLMPAGPELAGAAADYYRRNRTFLAAFEPAREESFFTQEGQRSLLTEEARLAEEDRSYRFYLSLREAPERIVGLVGLNNLVRGAFQSCFLGYKLDGGLLRRGYMTEAVEEAVRIAFTVLGLHRIEANIMPRNTASLGVTRKAGFQEEGLAVRYLRINGVWEDHIHMVRRNE